MHSRAPSLGQAMREGKEEEVYRCRGLYVQNLAELRIPEHRVVCYQCRISEPAVRARRHTGRAATVCQRESGNSQGGEWRLGRTTACSEHASSMVCFRRQPRRQTSRAALVGSASTRSSKCTLLGWRVASTACQENLLQTPRFMPMMARGE